MTSIDCCLLQKETALHYAVKSKSDEICEILLKNGAKGDKKDKQGRTALHAVMEPLIDRAVSVNTP